MIALLLLAALHATPAPSVNGGPYTHAQRLVDIGNGRHMNLYCLGHGSPTVIFDSGLGVAAGTLDWNHVQPAVAQFTQACSYDRAGHGFSDPGPLPRTANAVVSDLHALLGGAGIAPPYILVAHSLAGLFEPLFADRYPAEVVGMVLVDPSTPGQEELYSTEYPKYTAYEKQQDLRLHECADDPAQKQCQLPADPHLSAALNAVIRGLLAKPGPWLDSASEFESIAEDGAELNSAAPEFGTMPLIVLTSIADEKTMQPVMGATNGQVTDVENGWISLHDQLAAQSTRGVNCVIAGVGHYMQADKPDVVIQAIQQVMRLIPTDEKPSCAAWPSPKPRPTAAR